MFHDSVELVWSKTGEYLNSDKVFLMYEQALDWALECTWMEDEDFIREMTVNQVLLAIDFRYEGGLSAFLETCNFSELDLTE